MVKLIGWLLKREKLISINLDRQMVKDLAKALARQAFNSIPPLYSSTLVIGLRILQQSPMDHFQQVHERPYSSFFKILGMGREKYNGHNSRRVLYEEFRRQLVHLRETSTSTSDKRDSNRLLNNLERDESEKNVLSYPTRAHIELSNFCNLRCQMCGQSYFDGTISPRKHMAKEAYDEIVKNLPYLDETIATGFGESMLSPYFWEFMELLPWGGLKRLITNGILLTKESTERLMKYPLTEYFISFEAVDKGT